MTIIIFLIIIAILVLVHEFGHFIVAKKAGIKVEEFGIGFPPKLFSFKPKNSETTYSLNLIPFGGFVKIFGEDPDEVSISGPDSSRSFVNKPKYIQICILIAGVFLNALFAWFLIVVGYSVGLPMAINDENERYAQNIELSVLMVIPDSPAEKAGVKVGDSIVSISKGAVYLDNPTAEVVQNFISESNKEEIKIKYERMNKTSEVTLRAEDGIVSENIAIGITMDKVGVVKFPIIKSIKEGTSTTLVLLEAITVGLGHFIFSAVTGGASLSQVSGPIGIIGMVGDAAELGLVYILSFTAIISLHLAVLNLIPFPALDGGRILFVIVEGIKGSPINPKIQNSLNMVGFALLILLMVVVTYSDIVKLF